MSSCSSLPPPALLLNCKPQQMQICLCTVKYKYIADTKQIQCKSTRMHKLYVLIIKCLKIATSIQSSQSLPPIASWIQASGMQEWNHRSCPLFRECSRVALACFESAVTRLIYQQSPLCRQEEPDVSCVVLTALGTVLF